jgi:hypothetical protein
VTTDAEMRELLWTVKRLHKAIRQHLHPLLRGKEPAIQSAALADLTASYIAGLDPAVRAEFRDMFMQLVDALVPENEREMFGPGGWHQ